MKLDSRVFCRSERETLWAAIFDPEAWKASVPDAQDYEEVDDNEYEMTVKVDFGPLKGSQTVKIIFSDLDEPHSCKLRVENKLVKSMLGSYTLELPGESSDNTLEAGGETESTNTDDNTEEDETPEETVIPAETRTIFRYHLDVDMGNPMFNAIAETFKGRAESGFAEILGRLDNYAMSGTAEATD